MGRRQQTITIEDRTVPNPENPDASPVMLPAGRDKGKVFILTEMPATKGDEWVTQAQYLLGRAALEFEGLPADHPMVAMGRLRALKDPSLRAWWDCVRYQHNPAHAPQPIVQGDACQIEETRTINELLMAVYELHTGFFSPESSQTLGSPSSAIPTGSLPTRISRPRSGR